MNHRSRVYLILSLLTISGFILSPFQPLTQGLASHELPTTSDFRPSLAMSIGKSLRSAVITYLEDLTLLIEKPLVFYKYVIDFDQALYFASHNLFDPFHISSMYPVSLVYVSGTIEEDTTWTKDNSPYVIDGNLTVAPGVTLTIESGVIVKFDDGISLTVNGILVAQGEEGDEIFFTSLKDDTVGGDTNGDGDASSPAPGDWSQVWINGDGQVSLTHTTLRYGGHAGYGILTAWYSVNSLSLQNTTLQFSSNRGIYAMEGSTLTISDSSITDNAFYGVYLSNAQLTLQTSTIANNGSDGVYAHGNNATIVLNSNEISNNGDDGVNAAGQASLFNNTIHDNANDGIELCIGEDVPVPSITDNTVQDNARDALFVNYDGGAGLPTLSGNTFSGNGLDHGIGLGGHIGQDMSLHPDFYPDLTYVIQSLSIDNGATLTLDAGVVLKLDQQSSLTVNGGLLAQGEEGNEIVFTSLKDDTVGGDTNGDGDASSPAPGDWSQVWINGGGQVSLTHTTLRYGGHAGYGILTAWYSVNSLSLQNTTLLYSASHGVYAREGSILDVSDSSITGHAYDGLYLYNAQLTLQTSTIANNGSDGVYAYGNNTITLDSNEISYNGDNGVNAAGQVSLAGNTIHDNANDGIELHIGMDVPMPSVMDNAVQDNTRDALFVYYEGGAGLPTLSGNTFSGNGLDHGIGLGGNIGQDMSLTPGFYPNLTYVIQNLFIDSGVTLTLEAGTILKIDARTSITINGDLIALGEEDNEVIFTSLKDDTVGGDTNGDGSASTPTPGDWVHVWTGDGGTIDLAFTSLSYGGYGGKGILTAWYENSTLTLFNATIQHGSSHGIYAQGNSALNIDQSSVIENGTYGINISNAQLTLQNSSVANNGADGVYAYGSNSLLVLENNEISHNGDNGVTVSGDVTLSGNTIQENASDGIELSIVKDMPAPTINDNLIQNNTRDAIYVNYNGGSGLPTLSGNTFSGNGLDHGIGLGGNIGQDMSLTPGFYPNLTYVIQNLFIDSGVTLTLDAGVVLKFDQYTTLSVSGVLNALGEEGNEITLSSLKDDTVGGDTNGDGDASSPAPGDWRHVWINDGGQANMTYTRLHYGGYSSYGILSLWQNGSLQLQNSYLQYGSFSGVYGANNASLTISACTIQNNRTNGIHISNAQLSLQDSSITDNGSDGIQADGVNSDLNIIGNVIADNSDNGLALSGQITLSNNTIRDNANDGIELHIISDMPVPTIYDNLIQDNVRDAIFVYYDGGSGLPNLSDNTFTGNGLDHGIGLGGHLAEDMSLPPNFYPDLTYVNQSLIIDNGATLTLESGTILKFDQYANLTVNGSFVAQGEEDNQIILTSIKDDSVGGDTNGDGDASHPAPGDWRNIWIGNDSQASLSFTTVGFGGYAGYGNLVLWSGTNSLILSDALISNSASRGIYASDDSILDINNSVIEENNFHGITLSNAQLTMQHSRVQNNNDRGIRVSNSDVTIAQSVIAGNGTYGIENISPETTVTATYNYWGHPSGPYHPDTNPNGQGDQVSDGVAYDPWLVSIGDREPVPIELDQPLADFVYPMDYKDYYLDTSSGLTLVVEVTPLEGSEELWVYSRLDAMPLWTMYDQLVKWKTERGTYELLIPYSDQGRYFFSVYGRDVDVDGGSYQIVVKAIDRHLSSVTPRSAGNAGGVTLKVSGMPFVEGMEVQLRGTGLPTYVSDQVTILSVKNLWAHFDLSGATTGVYDLYARWPGGGEEMLPSAFTITGGVGPILESRLIPPEFVRAGRPYVLWLEYGNVGDADMPAPLFIISSPENAPMRLSPSEPYTQGPIQVLGINFDQPAGVLPPGKEFRIPIYFVSTATWFVQFDLESLVADTNPIDWEEIESEVQPEYLDPQLWDTLWANFTNNTGTTWQDYLRILNDQATYLARFGCPTYDVRQLFQSLISHAAGVYLRQTVAWGLDAYAPARGIPLMLERVSYDTLHQRFTVGPFGRGWSHNFEYGLIKPQPDRILIKGPGGTSRAFVKISDGSWASLPGDYGVLEDLGGGTYKLSEQSGLSKTFNIEGRLITLGEPNGNTLSLTYVGDRLIEIRHTNGQAITFEYYGNGLIHFVTDHAGRITEYVYDEDEALLLHVIATGNVTYAYSYIPPASSPKDYALQSVTYPDDTHEYFDYDDQGRIDEIWRDGGAEHVSLTYDNFGSVFITDSLDNTFTVRLGVRGEILEIENPLRHKTHLEYDADYNLTQLIQPSGASYKLSYDALGNPLRFNDPLNHTTFLGYNINPSRMDWLRDARGYLTDFTFETGNLTRIEYPDESAEIFEYDPSDGDLEIYTNRREDTITFTINDLGELTDIDYADGTWADYHHDGMERQWTITDETGTITIDYDDRGYLSYVEYPSGHWIEYTYNDAGRRERMETDDGLVLKYGYDDAGRLESLSNEDDFEIIHYTYNDIGLLETETRGNGTYTSYDYDDAGQLHLITHFAPDNSIQAQFEYQYNEDGYPTSMTTLDGTTIYGYDDLGQMTDVTYPDDRLVIYEYDAVGNRLSVTDDGSVTEYTPNNLNQYTLVGDISYTYDDDGNLETRVQGEATTIYGYDIENSLVTLETPDDGMWEYTYDALGNRVAVEHNSEVFQYLHDLTGYTDVIAEYDQNNQLIAYYITGLGLVAQLDAHGDFSYYAFDSMGNTRLITDTTGNVINTYNYTPFGNLEQINETIPNPFRYVGRFGVMQNGDGLVYMRARYYDPMLGRFLSTDPTGMVDDLNLYSYVSNAPTVHLDPSGLGKSFRDWARLYKRQQELRLNGDWTDERTYEEYNRIGQELQKAGRQYNQGTLIKYPISWIIKKLPGKTGIAIRVAWPIMTALGIGLDAWLLREEGVLPRVDLDSPKDSLPRDSLGSASSSVVYASDPNEKVSPAGIGEGHAVDPTEFLHYTIYFENVETADVPAQEVFVTDSLDTDLDWSTLDITEIAFGDQLIAIPEVTDQFYTRESILDYRPENDKTWWVDITIEVNTQTGLLSATFRTLDPETEDLPADPFAGFLPPNDESGRGEGHISLSIRPKTDRPFGTEVTNFASIVFDKNDPILTNTVSNVLGIHRIYLPIVISTVTD